MKLALHQFLVFCTAALTATAQAQSKNLQLLGMLHTPQKVITPLQINDKGFAAELYNIVTRINTIDGLSGNVGAKPEVSLLVWVANEDQFLISTDSNETQGKSIPSKTVIDNFKENIRTKNKIPVGKNIPYLDIIQTDGYSNYAFFQDVTELFATKTLSNTTSLSLMDLSQDAPETQKEILKAVSKNLNATILPFNTTAAPVSLSTDDDGGNIEVTPDGIPYVGSTTSSTLRTEIKKRTGIEPLVLPTEWLFVGHIDEFLTFLPTSDSCGSTLIYADPIEAINFIRQFNKTPLIPREDFEGLGANIENPEEYKKKFFNSLNYFILPASKNKTYLLLSDFDHKKSVRDNTKIVSQMDAEFLGNLNAYTQIQEAVKILQKSRPNICTKNITKIPSLFYNRNGIPFGLDDIDGSITRGYTAISGYINLISIRNHVIISRELIKGQYIDENQNLFPIEKSAQGFFGPIVKKRLAKVLGGEQFVHEINADYYEQGAGSAHCTTNVVRSLEKWK